MDKNMKMQQRTTSLGQGLVEFALVIPILLLLFWGIIEASRLLFVYNSVMLSSREAVRYGSATGKVAGGKTYYQDCTGIRNAAIRVGGLAGVSSGDVTITYDHGPGTGSFSSCPPSIDSVEFGDRIVVQVDTQWSPLLPLGSFSGFNISSESGRTIIKELVLE